MDTLQDQAQAYFDAEPAALGITYQVADTLFVAFVRNFDGRAEVLTSGRYQESVEGTLDRYIEAMARR